MLSIDATQDKRRQLAYIRPIVLVRIVVSYPSSTTYYFSHNARSHGGNWYLDYLMEISEIVESINHFDSDARPASLSLRIANGPYGSGTMLDEFLSVTYENAQVIVEEILLGDGESAQKPSGAVVKRFDGRVRTISDIDDNSFTFHCTDVWMAVEDSVDWRVVTESDPAPPSEVNKRFPKPYGAGALVQCVAWDIGASTTLAQDIDEDDTGNIKFTDVTQFPSGSNTIMIGAEKITYNGKNDANQTLNITARGQGDTDAVIHKVGETVIELQTNHDWVAADGADMHACNNVYFRSPTSGELVDITDVATVTLEDTALVSGRTVTSVRLTSTDLETLKELDNITQQPSAAGIQESSFGEDFDTGYLSARAEWLFESPTGLPQCTATDGTGDTDLYRFLVFDKAANVTVLRFRVGFMFQVYSMPNYYSAHSVVIRVQGPSGEGEDVTKNISTPASDGDSYSGQSSWQTVTGNKTLNDFVNASKSKGSTDPWLRIRNYFSTGAETDSARIEFRTLFVEFDTEGGGTVAASFAGGFGLELWANMDGPEVPTGDSTYSVSAGTLIEKDYDMARHIFQEQAGIASGALASDWNTEGALEETNSEHVMVLNDLGTKLSDLVTGLASESRLNMFTQAGKAELRRRRQSPPGYTAEDVTFSKANVSGGFQVSIRPLEEIWNILSARYGQDRSILAGSPDDQFEGRVVAEDATSKTKFGDRELDPFTFITIGTSAVAQETLDELLQEHKDRRYTVSFLAPYYDTYLLELGDVVKVQLPFLSSTIDVRVLEIRRNLEEEVSRITGIEVLTS